MATYQQQIDRLRELGPRFSGNDAHRALIEDVATALRELGYDVHRDPHTFDGWDATSDQIGLQIGQQQIPLSSAWPYSGETGPEGVTGELVLVHGLRKNWRAAAGKIAVIEVQNLDVPARLLLDSWGGDLPFETVANPVIGSELAGTDLTKAREAGVLGVVALWRGLATAAAHGQYLPFTRDYQDLPAVWVPESARQDVLTAARNHATATLTLNAQTSPASMDTLWAVSPGTGPHANESVLVVTHSDGGNAVEENGHIGLITLARDAAATGHDRTIVFVYTAGHLRIPAVTEHGQATDAWLEAHRDLWSRDAGGLTAVAGLGIEHLGARRFTTDPATGQYTADGTLEPELLYATTPELADLVRQTWHGATEHASPVKPGGLVHLGEGEPLYEAKIPAVALVTGPLYLLAELDDDLVDIGALTRQIDSFRRLQTHLAGTADPTSFGTVSLPGKPKKLTATCRALAFIATHRIGTSRLD